MPDRARRAALPVFLICAAALSAQSTSLNYPHPRKGDVVDDYHGTKVADPYRWMEDLNAPEVKQWVDAENTITSKYLDTLPQRDALKKRITELWNYPKVTAPRYEGRHWFYSRNSGLQRQSVVFTRETLNGSETVALDPNNREAVSNLFEYYLEAPGIMGGGIDKAENLVTRISKLDPPAGYHAQAQLERKRDRFEAAEEQLRHAAEIAPRQAGRLIDLARFLADRGRVKESDEQFSAAAHISPDSPQLLFARAETYIRQKRNLKDARQLLERYIASQLTPDDPPREEARALLAKTGQ